MGVLSSPNQGQVGGMVELAGDRDLKTKCQAPLLLRLGKLQGVSYTAWNFPSVAEPHVPRWAMMVG